MRCASCGADTRVLETRQADEGASVRRRRACSACGERFTTYERHERASLHVRKRDGIRQPFDRAKLRGGLARAAHKRPVPAAAIDAIVERIEAEALRAGGELPAQRIGEMCLAGLREIDRVSYLQFAAVYKELADIEAVQAELARLQSEEPEEAVFAGSSGRRSVRANGNPA